MFNRQEIFDSQLSHLADMASRPEWKRYVWDRAKQLAADESGLFAGIDRALTAAMADGPEGARGPGHQCPNEADYLNLTTTHRLEHAPNDPLEKIPSAHPGPR